MAKEEKYGKRLRLWIDLVRVIKKCPCPGVDFRAGSWNLGAEKAYFTKLSKDEKKPQHPGFPRGPPPWY